MKPPRVGKSRLRGVRQADAHAALVLALAADTLRAAVETTGVRRVLVVATEPESLTSLRELGVELVGERTSGPAPADPLNAALRTGERLLRADDPAAVVGALQADLPALRSDELAGALAESAGRRAFVADRHGTGTTLLLSAAGAPLAPRFGAGSAEAHRASGAVPLTVTAASLRSDVDTPDDLAHARALGLGKRTVTLLEGLCTA